MEEYTLKSFEKGFEEEQAKVGYEVARTWSFAHQTPLHDLREVYSKPDFDPETRHYCFKDGEMVGFLTSKIIEPKEDGRKRASLVFPSILPGNNDATDLLLHRAFDVLKKKEVEVVETYVTALSGNNYDLAHKWEYKYVKDVDNVVYILNGTEIKADLEAAEVRDFDKEKDLEKWLALVKEYDNPSEEGIEALLEELENDNGNIIAHLIIEKDGEIVGTTMIYKNEIRPDTANLPFTYVTETEYMKKLAVKVKEIGKEQNIDMFFIWLFRGRLKLREHFDELNFKYGQPSASLFEKILK